MHLFARDADGGYVLDEKASERRLVCRAGNPFGLPAKDRSRPPRCDRAARPRRAARQDQQDDRGGSVCDADRPDRLRPLRLIASKRRSETMYDLNDAQPQMPPTGEPIPDGTFAKIRMTIRPGGVDGAAPMDKGLLKASATERRQDARLRVHRPRGAVRQAQVLAELHRRRRQGRRERRLEGLEHLQGRLPRDDRQRARPRSAGRQRGGEGRNG